VDDSPYRPTLNVAVRIRLLMLASNTSKIMFYCMGDNRLFFFYLFSMSLMGTFLSQPNVARFCFLDLVTLMFCSSSTDRSKWHEFYYPALLAYTITQWLPILIMAVTVCWPRAGNC